MAADADQKTEAPTPRRAQEAAREGDSLQSREVGTALVIVGGVLWLWLVGPMFAGACREVLSQGLRISHADVVAFDPSRALLPLLLPVALPVAALFGLSLVAASTGPALLGSLGFRCGAFAFKASRIDPLAGVKRIMSVHGLIELAKSVAKAIVLGSIGYWLLAHRLPIILRLGATSVTDSARIVGGLFTAIFAWLAVGLIGIALIDVPAQVFQRNRRLRMSKEEVREELKQTEGSPETKRAMRQRQHEVLSGSARKAVADATVVLTNPTHFAIALRYRPTKDSAPVVVARGRGETALAIRTLAEKGTVPILEYPQLARAIYFTSRAGQSVAEDLYVAVATVLAFVFRLDQALAQGVEQPSVLVPESRRFDENGRLHQA